MNLEKNKRWIEKDYTRWVATLPCANCRLHDETIVAHHLKHVGMEITTGMGTKASDWLTMPLCFNCHYKLHNGDTNIKGYQYTMLYRTLDKAFNSGIIVYHPKLLMSKDEQRQWRKTKLIKAKHFLSASGTVAERDAISYNSKEFTTYVDNLRDATIDLEILEAKRESWQREIEIWRTLSANRRR